MGYRAYELAMGFASEELPEDVTFEDVDGPDFFSTIYYKRGMPVIAHFYSNTREADKKAFDAIKTKVGPDYYSNLNPRGLGHFTIYFEAKDKHE